MLGAAGELKSGNKVFTLERFNPTFCPLLFHLTVFVLSHADLRPLFGVLLRSCGPVPSVATAVTTALAGGRRRGWQETLTGRGTQDSKAGQAWRSSAQLSIYRVVFLPAASKTVW